MCPKKESRFSVKVDIVVVVILLFHGTSLLDVPTLKPGAAVCTSPEKSWTHPPTGPVEGTLEHRPQLAVETFSQTL